MITRNRVHTRVERHGGHRNEVNPAHCVLAVFVTSKGISNPRKSGAGDVNISGVDFWHAVEFSRNGHFLRTAFQRTLRAFRSFVSSAYQIRARALSRLAFESHCLAALPFGFP